MTLIYWFNIKDYLNLYNIINNFIIDIFNTRW